MAELADAHGSGPCPVTRVRVQVPLGAVLGRFHVLILKISTFSILE